MTASAAFFDLDRTLMSGSSAYYFAKAAYREGLRPVRGLASDAVGALVFKLVGASDEQSEALRDRILASVAGTRAEDFLKLTPGVVEELLPRIRPESQALLDMHHEAGRDVYIVSASPVEIVGELAAALEMEGGLGTQSEIIDGVYTGRLAAPFCYGEGKAEVARRLVAERGYDLAQCYAYSDSSTDLPMLEAVGYPSAVNPDRALRKIAVERGWPILAFARPVSLRSRLAMRRPSAPVVAGAAMGVGAAVAGLAWYAQRRRARA